MEERSDGDPPAHDRIIPGPTHGAIPKMNRAKRGNSSEKIRDQTETPTGF